MVRGRAELAEICDRLTGKGIDRVFVPGGDADPPAGDYPDALTLLGGPDRAGPAVPARRHHRLPGVAPDDQRRPDHPVDVGQAPLRHARGQQPDLRPRRAQRPGSTGCAAAASPCRCCSASRARSTAPSCSRWPTKIGVGESTRFLVKHKGTFARLAAPGGFTGERFLREVRRRRWPARRSLVEGLHVFTFNQVAETEAWRRDLPRPADGLDRLRRGAPAGDPG